MFQVPSHDEVQMNIPRKFQSGERSFSEHHVHGAETVLSNGETVTVPIVFTNQDFVTHSDLEGMTLYHKELWRVYKYDGIIIDVTELKLLGYTIDEDRDSQEDGIEFLPFLALLVVSEQVLMFKYESVTIFTNSMRIVFVEFVFVESV
jgi:hypothetical protein